MTPDERIAMISRKVKRYMSDNRIRYADMAAATGLSIQSISNQLNMNRGFSGKSARRWAEGFALLGFPINESFLLTGEGPITDRSAFDPDINHAFSAPFRAELETDEPQEGDASLPIRDKAIVKLIRIRRERDELYAHYQELLAENKRLKVKLDAIKELVNLEDNL